MTKLNAKLIVSDFDGTLITSDGKVLPDVAEAIDRYIADGGIFAVCTGRVLASILPQVRRLGLKGLVSACQSSVIADIETGAFIRHGGLSCEQTSEICEAIESCGQSVNVYSDDRFFSDIPADNKFLKLYESIINLTAEHADVKLSRYVKEKHLTCQKVASLCPAEAREGLFEYLSEKFKGKYDVTCSAEVLVEVSPLGDTKGAGIRFMASHYGIDIANTVAIGDNLNDLSMIEAAGVGVAVGNAVRELKERADYVSVTNNEGAVAEIIKRFGYCHD